MGFSKKKQYTDVITLRKKKNVSLTKHPATAHFNECNTFTVIKGVDCP